MTVDELVDKLARPIYVLRMARPHGDVIVSSSGYPTQAMIKSAKTRANNARKEIDNIVSSYVGSR